MTEFVLDHEKYMSPLGEDLREVGVLVEPLTIVEKALEQVWDVQERLPWGCKMESGKPGKYQHSPLVLGAGPVGLLGAMAIAAAGFETFVYSRERPGGPRSHIVEAIGAKFFSAEFVPVAELPKLIDNIDLVYEATGASKLCFRVMKHLGSNGVFVFTGVPGRRG